MQGGLTQILLFALQTIEARYHTGKFQLKLLYGSGHIIQEDCPEKVAEALLEFCGRVLCTTTFNQGADLLAERLAKARQMIPK